tara:strand:+ start:2789 stop:2968 length:180 start_codon:yes stop_codon:yes gene_type:complete
MSAPLQLVRLPQAPNEYNQSYMARLINTIELERQATYFAQSVSIDNAAEKAEASGWFIA